VPPAHLLPERTTAVLGTVYLLFHEGYVAGRADLRSHARFLARTVAELMPDDSEAAGLYALLLVLDGRSAARVDHDGALVPLEEQDRTRWDTAMIAEGLATIRRALRRAQPGPYQVQALIAGCHVLPVTDWARIATLYDHLLALVPSDTVRLNRAIAIAMRDGPDLALLDDVGEHPLLPATRADFLRRLGRNTEAAQEYRLAIEATGHEPEKAYLRRRLHEVSG
jgi:RNA polymerase sigma-70 factor (ECF subfamily)